MDKLVTLFIRAFDDKSTPKKVNQTGHDQQEESDFVDTDHF